MHRIALFLVLMIATLPLQGQPDCRAVAQAFQDTLDAEYKDSVKSPLEEHDRLEFEGLAFFPIDEAYCVQARFVRTPNETPFEMPTASGKTKTFVKYGMLYFKVNGVDEELTLYQNLKLAVQAEYKDYLFIPFRDWSSGEESYGGGRYIDFKIPEGEFATLDFNQCYNPYCAYSTGWNCPIPPAENYLETKILAGVKAWKGGH